MYAHRDPNTVNSNWHRTNSDVNSVTAAAAVYCLFNFIFVFFAPSIYRFNEIYSMRFVVVVLIFAGLI